MNDKRDQLYDNLINSGRVSEDEIGNREQFKAAISDEATSRQFYKNIINSGALTPDEIGSEDDFYGSISSDFAVPQQTPAPTGYKPSAEDMSKFMGTINRTKNVASGSVQNYDRRTQNLQKRQGLNVPQRVNIGESNNLVQGDQRINPETGQLDNTYITSLGNEYDNKSLADMEQRQIDQNIRNQRYKQSLPGQLEDAYAERDRLNAELAKLQGQWVDQDGRVHYGNRTNDEAAASLEAAIRQNEQRITTLEAERDDDGGTQFWRGFIDAAKNPSTLTFGLTDFSDMVQMMRIKNKIDAAIESGQQPRLSDAEQALMQSSFLNNYAQSEYGDNRGFMYRAGGISMQALPFVAEFMATGGMGAISQKGAELGTRSAEKLALQGLSRTLVKNLGVLAGDVAAGWAMANTTGLFRTAGDVMQRNIGNITINPEGQYDFGEYDEEGNYQRGGKSLGRSIYEAEVANTLEYYTEKLGEHLQIGKWLAKGAEKMGLSKLSKAVNYLSGSKWLERGGIQDYPSEVVEEEANLILNSALVGDNKFSDLVDGKTQMDIWGGMLFSIGLMQAPRLAYTGTSAAGYYAYKKKVDIADKNASAVFGNDNWQMIKDEIDNCENDRIGELMQTVVDGDMTEEQKNATFDYAKNLIKMRGYNMGMMADTKNEEDSLSKEKIAAQTVDQNYQIGHETQEPDLMKQYTDEAKEAQQNLTQYGQEFAEWVTESKNPVETLDTLMDYDIFTDEQIAAAADYFQKISRVNGAMDGALDRINLKVEQANAEIRSNTHQGTDQVITAQIGDGAYYVIGGDVFTDPVTGATSVLGTGGAVVVKDALTGEVSVKSPQELTVTSMTPAGDMIRYNEEVLRQQLMQQADNDFTYGSPANEVYQLEDTVALNDGEGNIIEGQIGMMPNSVDGVYVVYTPDNKALQFTADQLNRMIVAHNGQEVQRASSVSNQVKTVPELTETVPEESGNVQNQPQPAQSGETAGGEASAENGTGANEPPVSALDRIPILTDEKGQPVLKKGRPQYQWHKASVEDAAAALIETTNGDMVMARDTASDLVKNAQAGLEKIRKQKPKGVDPIEIAESRMDIKRQENEQQTIIKQWQDVNQAIQKQMRDEAAARQAEIEAAKSEEQRQREAEEARIRKEKQDEANRQRLREAIERDREKMNREYAPVVEARKEMADNPESLDILSNIEPQSLEEWVSSLILPHSMLWQDASESEIGLQSELGFRRADMQRMISLLGTKESGAKPFGKVVLDIYEGLPEAMKDQYTDEDVRNTLLNLFNEGSSTRMMHLTEENRIAQAREAYQENLRREAEAELEAWAEAYHLTPEERETYEDFLAQSLMDGAETKFINQIIAENEEQNSRSEAVDMQPASGTAGRESEGGESQVQGQSAAETSGTDQNQRQPEQRAEAVNGEPSVPDTNVHGGTPEPGIAPSEQLKPTDLRDAVRVESPEIGVAEANARAKEAAGEIQPIGTGDFGPIYDQFRGKPKEAIDFLVSKGEGEAIGVLSHKDIGEIDLVWGEEGTGHSDGFGLAKLVKYHPEVLDNLQGILDEMEVVKRTDNRINLESEKYKAAVRLTWNEQSKTWLLTIFEKKNSALDNTTDTDKTSNRGKRNDTATPQSTVSGSKDTNNPANLQEKTEKSSKKSVKEPKRLVSDDRMEELKKIFRNKIGGQLNVGVDPEILAAGAEMAVGYLERGITKFADFAKAMIEEVGDFMRPYLKSFYNAVRDMPETQSYADQMDDYETVRKFDVHNFDKGGKVPDAITKAKQVSDEQKVSRQTKKIKQQHPNLFEGDLFSEQDSNTSTPAQIAAEEDKVDTNPTEAQKEAGNYQKGHIKVDGYDITIENPKGSTRSGVDQSGKAWSQVMNNTYGYIRGTEGVDGDHIDVFLSDNPTSGQVFVVDQVNPETGEFDEHKALLGYADAAEATQAYLSNYEPGWKGLGAISGVSHEAFKEWINSSHRKTKPFREYALAKREQQKHLQSVKDRVDEHLKKYRTLAPVEVISVDSDEDMKRIAGEDIDKVRQYLKDSKLPAVYDSELKNIYIFAENITEGDIEEALFHENIHRGLHQYYGDGPIELAESFWDTESPTNPEATKTRKEAISEAYKDKPQDIKEEYFTHALGHQMVTGSAGNIIARLSPEHQEIINNILYNIGYDTAEETRQRKQTGKQDQKGDGEEISTPIQETGHGRGRVEPTSSTDKIEDVGEVIEGARKDLRKKLAQTIESATKQTLTELPFSKAYKKPDLKKAVDEGALREKDATFYDAWFTTMVNPTKPKLTQSEVRSKKWNPGFKSKLEKWVDQTYEALQMLKNFVEASEEERDNIIARMTEDKFPDREAQLAEIEKRKEWNKDRKHVEWGDKTTPNPLWITYEVMKQMDYTPGDKLDIPYGIVVGNTSGNGYTLYNNKGERYYDLSPKTIEEAIDDIVYLTKMKRGDTDIQHPVSMFYTVPTKSEMGETGKYRVMWGSWNSPKTQVFDSKEDADAFAEKKKEAIVSPVSEVVRRFGYKAMFRHPLTGEKIAVNDQEFDTKEEALEYIEGNYENLNSEINAKLAKEKGGREKTELKPEDIVYTALVRDKDGKYSYAVLIDKKYANNFGDPLIIKEGFATRNDAKDFLEKTKDSLFQTYKSYKDQLKSFTFFASGADTRKGEDYRGGKDVTAEDFMNTFGFRGVQFGNWTNQRDRQMAVNQAYDSFLDLAKLLGISPKAVSLNGELGIAFGARGVGGFAAHYEPGEIVINLTKTMGAGSLAHEWWHALDNYFSRSAGQSMGMVTDDTAIPMRKELRDAYNNLLSQIRQSNYYLRSRQKGDYWGRMHEVTARLLAEWVDQELKKRGELNTFLSRGASTETIMKINYEKYMTHSELAGKEPMKFDEFKQLEKALAGSPYPSAAEVDKFSAAMRHIFDVMLERTDDETGKVALYQKVTGDNISTPDSRETALRDALIDQMRDAGVLVGTDAEIGQEILDEFGGNVKTSKGNYFKTENGRAYGYTYNGKIYIDPSIATSETPIHEYTHLWTEALRQKDPEQWENIVDVLKNDEAVKPFWDKVAKQYPELKDENDIAEEVLAQYSGRRGSERLREVADEVAKENKGIFGKAQAVVALQKMRNILTRFWKSVAEMMGWKFTKAEEVADKVLSDLLNGVNPDSQVEERETPVFVSNAERAVDGIKQDKATPEQWLAMISKAGGLKAGEDKWLGLSDWLNEQQKDKKSITKQEVMDYIRQNQIQIEEVKYGDQKDLMNDEMEKRMPGWKDAFRINPFYDEFEIVVVDDKKALDLFNTNVDESDRHELENGRLNNYDRSDVKSWAEDMVSMTPFPNDVKRIDSTREQYTTNGLEDRKEIALTVPTVEPYKKDDQIHFGDAGEGRAVAWIRFGDTTDADGNKVLVIDEIQSKRHQDAREKGYKSDVVSQEEIDTVVKEAAKIENTTEETVRRYPRLVASSLRKKDSALSNRLLQVFGENKVPDAPFEKNWHELAMKRMLRYAAENGYDKIAWTTGKQQGERYNLAKKIEDFYYKKNDDGTYDISAVAIDKSRGYTDYPEFNYSNQTEKDLINLLGKDLAKKIIDGEGRKGYTHNGTNDWTTFKGNDLKLGAEGMIGFYDQILPRFMNKYGKKWGVKTGEIELPDLEKSAQTMWSIDVTPEMKESVMQGQPMFQRVSDDAEDVEVPDFTDADIAQTMYNQTLAKGSTKWKEAWQDSMVSLKAIQDAIAKESGNKATGAEDAYRFENRMHGRSKNMSEQFDWQYYQPMLRAFDDFTKDRDMSIEQTMDYMIAKHGLERNMYYSFRDAMKEKVMEQIKEEREELEKQYARNRISELDYNRQLASLKEKEATGVDDAIEELRASEEYKQLLDDYQNGRISYPEYIRGNEELRREASQRKTPKKDGEGNIVSTNYYDDYAKDYSGLTGTFAKNLYEDAQKVKRQAQRTVDPETRKKLWSAYDKRMREAYQVALSMAEDMINSAEETGLPMIETAAGKLWDAVNAATKRTLQISYESGMMDRKTYDKVRKMFDFYIPLRGWAEDKASDVYNYIGRENVFSPAIKKTWGRTSEAENPLAYIGNIAVSTILAGHRNLLKQHFLNYVMNNPTSLVSVSESWYENIGNENGQPVWVLRTADTAGKSPDEIIQIVNDFNEEMLRKQAEGKAIPVTGRLRLDVNATKGQKAEHVVEVKRGGHSYELYINGDPRAAQALNGTIEKAVSRISDTWLGKSLANLNRNMAAFFTSKNPAFVVSNLSRDLNMAGASVAVKEGKEYNAKFIKNVAKVLAPRIGESSNWIPSEKQPTGLMPSLMRKYKKGTLDTSDETERLFKEFMDEGAETGFVNMLSVDSFKDKMQKEIKQMQGSSLFGGKLKETTVGKGLRLMGETFEFYNRCAEDATRFIVYMTSRQMGKNLEDAIADAKDVTLNFNRKGTGDKGNAEIRDLFIFVNPAIQALANMYSMAKKKPLRLGAVVTGFITGGILVPIINQWLINMLGDDDDKDSYWNLPPWVRKNNLVMWVPFTQNFLTIPLAQEFRVFYGIGEMIGSYAEKHPHEGAGLEIVESLADLVPINPTGNGGNLLVDFAPTGIQPLLQINENVDFTGKPIWKDNQGNKYDPAYTKAYVSTPKAMVKISEAINSATGGNEDKRGWLEQNKWGSYLNNPAVWNHLLQGYFGGMYNTISKAVDTGTSVAKGEMPEIYRVPVINRFLNRPSERESSSTLGEDYWNLIDEHDEFMHDLRAKQSKAAEGDKDAQKYIDELVRSDEYKRIEIIDHYKKIIDDLRKGEKAATESADKGDIKATINMYRDQMMEEIAAVDGDTDPMQAAKKKFDEATTFAEKNRLRQRMESVMLRGEPKKKLKKRSEEVEKALSYKDDYEKESRDVNDEYLMVANSSDIEEDTRLKDLKKKVKEHTSQYKQLVNQGKMFDAAKYRTDNNKWFAADQMISSNEKAIKDNMKLLGKGRDANIMKLIRDRRAYIMKQADNILKQ